MSPLWRDRLLISLAPSSAALARATGWLRPRLVMKQVVACDPGYGQEPWRGAVAALAALLTPLARERVDATVVLSNEFVRYALVPFDRAARTTGDGLALARFQFVRLHGERARSWDVRLSEAPRGGARIASAVDGDFVAAIRAAAPAGGRIRLVSVQPYLMSAVNRWRAGLDGEAWLLLVEPGRACLALAAGRQWLAVHAARGEFRAPEDWIALLERQRLRTGSSRPGGTVLVHAPWFANVPPAEAHGWKFTRLALPALDGFLPLEDAAHGMALTAQ